LKYPYLASRLLNKPLMIHPDKLSVIMQALQDRIGIEATWATGQSPPQQIMVLQSPIQQTVTAPAAEPFDLVQDGVAIIPVIGTLAHRGGGINALSGLTTYTEIRKAFQAAMGSQDVKTIVFDIDSGGGEVDGAFDLANYIWSRGVAESKKGAKGKRILAFVNEAAFSAAYLLASAAQRVLIPPTGMVGSVGVIAQHVDQSKADEQAGLQYTAIYAGKYKNDMTPHQPLSDHARETLQARVDEVYRLFVETVARNRGMSPSVVDGTEAGIFTADEAVKLKLVDQIISWSDFMSQAGLNLQTRRRKMTNLEQDVLDGLEARTETEAEAAKNEATNAAVVKAKAEIDFLLEQAKEEGRQEMLAVVQEVLGYCALADMHSLAGSLLTSTKIDRQAVRSAVLEAKQKAAAAIMTANDGWKEKNQAEHPLITAVKAKFKRGE
jgi:signal peptide peptidase SppA